MNILYVLPSIKNQAPIKIALTLAKGMLLRGHRVSIIYFDEEVELEIPDGISANRIRFFSRYDLSNFDIIHSHLMRSDFFVSINNLTRKSKTISTLHNYSYKELKSYYGLFYSLFFGTLWNLSWLNFSSLVSLTNHGKDYYKKISFNKSVTCIYNGVDVDVDVDVQSLNPHVISAIYSLKDKGYNIIGTYCNLTKRKRIDWLVNHVANNENSALVVIGDGTEKKTLKLLVESKCLSARVLFVDYVSNAHQFNVFFDVYCIPSIHEGFGLALIEAALHKKNIVCSSIPTFKELFSEKEVFFFSTNSQCSLDDAINDSLKSYKGELAHQKALVNYSEEVMVNNYFLEYKRLTEI